MHSRCLIVSACLFVLWCAFLIYPLFAISQPISQQEWQTATIASGLITVDCANSLLPYDKGDFLDEPSLFTVRGEMDESMRSAFPVKICLQPESGNSGILAVIAGCTDDGARVELRVCDAGETITIQDSAAGNSGGMQFLDDLDIILDDPVKVIILERINGVLMAIGSGSSSSGGANLVLQDGQKLDLSAVDSQNTNEGLIIKGNVTNCSGAITLGQVCYDSDDNAWCIGTGTAITCISGTTCTDSVDCFNNLISQINITPFKILDNNNDGFVFDISGGGPRLRCMTDFGGAGQAECTPSEVKSFAFLSGAADGTECIREFDVAINDEVAPIGYHCLDNDTGGGGTIRFQMPAPDRWDGAGLKIRAFLHSNEATPAGDVNLDWVGYCAIANGTVQTSNYPAATANSEMVIDLDGLSGTDRIAVGVTVGDIPLTGCTGANPKILFLEATMDETSTTADNESSQILIGFLAEYDSKQYSDD